VGLLYIAATLQLLFLKDKDRNESTDENCIRLAVEAHTVSLFPLSKLL
jgi:hypothetical protein